MYIRTREPASRVDPEPGEGDRPYLFENEKGAEWVGSFRYGPIGKWPRMNIITAVPTIEKLIS